MSATTGVTAIDRTIHKTNAWLDAVCDELHTDDRQEAYRTLRAVLHTLRDRLIPDEAVHLGAQLPMVVRGLYFEGWKPSATPTDDDLDAFAGRVRDELEDRPGVPDPERKIRAVFAVLADRIDPGEIGDVVRSLPKTIRPLWPETVDRV